MGPRHVRFSLGLGRWEDDDFGGGDDSAEFSQARQVRVVAGAGTANGAAETTVRPKVNDGWLPLYSNTTIGANSFHDHNA
jgi:hypothetical protein